MKQNKVMPTKINDLTLPHKTDIEQYVLGALLSNTSASAQRSLVSLSAEAFYDVRNSMIFDAISECDERHGKVDFLEVAKILKQSKSAVTMSYLTELMTSVGSGSSVAMHTVTLLDLQIARQTALACHKALAASVEGCEDIGSVIEELSESIDFSQLVGQIQSNRKNIAEILSLSIEAAEARCTRLKQGITTGITTGLTALDKNNNGWQPGELIILAARPAMGKTAVMLHFALSAAMAQVPTPTVIYSLEMGNVSVGNRVLLSQCNVTPEAFKSGNLHSEDWAALAAAKDSIRHIPLSVDEKPAVTYQYIARHSRILHKQGKCGLILIDYLQLMTMVAGKGSTREREVANTTAALKQLAKELNVPIILLSQLSRETEKRGGRKEPMLSDLRESGAIEQDADMVIFIHRAEYYDRETTNFERFRLSNGKEVFNQVPLEGVGKLIIAKYREGATGDIKFAYNRSLTQITDFNETPYLFL